MRIGTFHSSIGIVCSLIFFTAFENTTNAQATLLTKQNQNAQEPFNMSARYHIESGKKTGYLIVKIELPKDSYIYSLTQKKPLIPSKISLNPNQRISSTGKFQPDQKPKVIDNDPIFQMRLEKHKGTVQFYAPIQIQDLNDLKNFHPKVLYSGQICSDKGFCQTIRNRAVTAKFAGFFEREAKRTLPGIQEK